MVSARSKLSRLMLAALCTFTYTFDRAEFLNAASRREFMASIAATYGIGMLAARAILSERISSAIVAITRLLPNWCRWMVQMVQS